MPQTLDDPVLLLIIEQIDALAKIDFSGLVAAARETRGGSPQNEYARIAIRAVKQAFCMEVVNGVLEQRKPSGLGAMLLAQYEDWDDDKIRMQLRTLDPVQWLTFLEDAETGYIIPAAAAGILRSS
jgi:hypothetical protein